MNNLIPSEVEKSAEGKYLKLKDNEPQQFVLYKSIELEHAGEGDDPKYFRKVVMEGVEKLIKYRIHLRQVGSGDVKEWSVGSASAINQLISIGADVNDTIEIEKVVVGTKPSDVRYRVKMVIKADGAEIAPDAPAEEAPAPKEE